MERRHTDDFASRLCQKLKLDVLPPRVRRIIIAVVGGTLLLIGLAMVVLPGPAFVVVPISLAILATEFVWARRYMLKARLLFRTAKQAVTGK